jgi:hypothetical protein
VVLLLIKNNYNAKNATSIATDAERINYELLLPKQSAYLLKDRFLYLPPIQFSYEEFKLDSKYFV